MNQSRENNVHSEKYGIDGILTDCGDRAILEFSRQGQDVKMTLIPMPPLLKHFEGDASELMDYYVDSIASEGKHTRLHYWYLKKVEDQYGKYITAFGNVTNHPKLMDSAHIHTSPVKAIYRMGDEIIVLTMNTEYHCPLAYCRFNDMAECSDFIPDFDLLREEYEGKNIHPTIEPGNILLVIADFCNYYYHSAYYIPSDNEESVPVSFFAREHVGDFKDSFLIQSTTGGIDLRYFPHWHNIEFYSECTHGKPLWIENIGDGTLYAKTSVGIIRLDAGERKLVDKSNAEKTDPFLDVGELYPTMFFD